MRRFINSTFCKNGPILALQLGMSRLLEPVLQVIVGYSKGDLRCQEVINQPIPTNKNAKPNILKKAMKSAAYRRKPPKPELGPPSIRKPAAARNPAQAAEKRKIMSRAVRVARSVARQRKP